jgi:2-oxoacid:acceptor oxidoreductase gamma subunit (pyruvate/2-ketoisovalerate family)
MFEIRFHGRGGQGAVTASEILALAIFKEGKYPQSFPSFGLERRGAPVAAYLRVDEKKIEIRQNIYKPDFVVVMDSTLLKLDVTLSGLKTDGGFLIDSPEPPEAFNSFGDFRIGTIDASDIAVRYGLGTSLLPITNTVILGALLKMTGIVSMKNLLSAIGESITKKTEENKSGAKEAFDRVKIGRTT